MNCECHGEPAYWSSSSRYRAGGFWYCAVKKNERARARYDTDPVHRISKNLHDHARRRGDTLKRQREAHYGPVPQ